MALAPDPSDKLDAAADGAFGGKPVNRRAGYGDRLEMALKFAKKGACLSAGEGQLIVEHYEEQLAAVEKERDAMESMYRHHVAVSLDAIAKLNRTEAILAALRKPSEAVMVGAFSAGAVWDVVTHTRKTIQLAVAAAEQEVGA